MKTCVGDYWSEHPNVDISYNEEETDMCPLCDALKKVKELEGRVEKTDELNDMVESYGEEVIDLEERLWHVEGSLDDANNELDDARGEIAKLENELDDVNGQLDELYEEKAGADL